MLQRRLGAARPLPLDVRTTVARAAILAFAFGFLAGVAVTTEWFRAGLL